MRVATNSQDANRQLQTQNNLSLGIRRRQRRRRWQLLFTVGRQWRRLIESEESASQSASQLSLNHSHIWRLAFGLLDNRTVTATATSIFIIIKPVERNRYAGNLIMKWSRRQVLFYLSSFRFRCFNDISIGYIGFLNIYSWSKNNFDFMPDFLI